MPTEILAGLYHWTAVHPNIGSRVSSYYVAAARAVIDPLEPEEGWDTLPGPIEVILLTSGHHSRGSAELAARLEVPIRTSPEAAHRLGDAPAVEVHAAGTEVAPNITSLHIGAISADEGAFHIAVGAGAIAFADGLVHSGAELGFVPDQLIGEKPEHVKRELARAFSALVTEQEFDHLLFAHGEPVVGGGRAALGAFAEAVLGDRTG